MYEEVTRPPLGREAFGRTDDAAVLTQAALLLVIGLQLRGGSVRGDPLEDTLPEEDLATLGIPPVPSTQGRIDSQRVRIFLARRYGVSVGGGGGTELDAVWRRDIFADLASIYFRDPSAGAADNLMEACLRHPHELIRVCAAAAYHERSSERDRVASILEQGTLSFDLLVRDVAATALAQVAPDNARLNDLQTLYRRATGAAGADTSMLVPGTWALGATWWQPGGDFHSYLIQTLRPDLYNQVDRFAWSGGYSDDARSLGADDLVKWVNVHKEQGLDLFTHSHGGNIAMLASNRGLRLGELVLLSCPVHFMKYRPDFGQVAKLVSIRVRLDLVILADRGGQRFRDSRVKENVLPIWFDHTETHNPEVWQNSTYGIPAML
jgi:hypothetical protein